jgi:hypothetical protein
MRHFLIILLVTIISCQAHRKENNDSTPITKDSDKPHLPQFVQNYLAKELSGWKIAPKDSWEDTTFKKYQTDSSQINYILADFNCDNKPDFAAILKDSIGNFAAFKIYSFDQYYLHDELANFGNQKKLGFGIRYLNPGATFQRYDGSLQTFDCGAIEKFFTNSNSKEIFYSNKKGTSFVIQKGE